eukprot:TRINITY_DN23698_c0_g1_i1.p1 TRINITY_DN23698_c0_g1~~TRINITY_DN23698_c0_g1_i1.p1  ORF type:complete len:135 (-),score=10.06 TRINITY_DN23698_c0_g1_i1:121-525(-)
MLGFVGRFMFCIVFLATATNHLMHFDTDVEILKNKTFPSELAPISLALSLSLLYAGGLLVLFSPSRWFVILGAVCLVLFILPITYYMHFVPFFLPKTSEIDKLQHLVEILKNVSIVGACLIFIEYENRLAALKQ